ncbi:MAG: zinc dependent phospholipase C family protein [Clostridiales bacterium]|jgi:hypothetical protein|nr:zinc dependent phospholipase C family protein [Clostridiales bacterium]
MPAVITHYLMGQKTIDTYGADALTVNVREHVEIFNLGCQGPDILFFARGDKKLNHLGEQMHKSGINAFFAECIKLVRKTAIGDGRAVLESYIAGFLCHYAMDTCTHPYIYYKSGFSSEDGALKGSFATAHRFLETTIDCILSKKLSNMNPYEQNIPKRLNAPKKEKKVVSYLLAEAISNSYNIERYPEDYAKAMRDMIRIYWVFRSKYGIRRNIITLIGRLVGDKGATGALIHYSPVNNLDYLNENQADWCYPWNDMFEINLTFNELTDRAIEDARIYISAFFKAVRKNLDDKIALNIIGNKNFSTGLEYDTKFLYYNNNLQELKRRVDKHDHN